MQTFQFLEICINETKQTNKRKVKTELLVTKLKVIQL